MSSLYTKTDLEQIYKTWYDDNDSGDEEKDAWRLTYNRSF